MNTFVISDIHGCFFTFKALLDTIGFTKSDTLFLLGDYIDRGPKSKEVLDEIIKLQLDGYHITALKGNHEDMIFDALNLENWGGGEKETLESFGITHFKDLDSNYINWFSKLKSYVNSDPYILVHAGLNFNTSHPLQDELSMRWIRNWYDKMDYAWLGDRKIIHGHVPTLRPEIEKMLEDFDRSKVLNIDNGCYMKGVNGLGGLCCIELNKKELVFQENID